MPQTFLNLNRYWLFQAIGWGLFILINVFFAATYDRLTEVFLFRLLVFVVFGLIFTHLMRISIRRLNLLGKSLEIQIGGLIGLTIIFSFLIGIIEAPLTEILRIRTVDEMLLNESIVILSNAFYAFVYLFIWNMIYFMFHYINTSRTQQLDTLKLQALVKELELKTIKSHINPHFIFNALNSIRALVDEDPGRAREAITTLSNILRSSMQAENVETVPLSRELNIVKDYLALEHIRFEDRLKVEFNIAEDTLQQAVPYMMLQTLVENAIKHGISKNLNGGLIYIFSERKEKELILTVRNTGQLNQHISKEGFGVQSTASRLLYMFGHNAHFEMYNLPENMVEAKVKIPLVS